MSGLPILASDPPPVATHTPGEKERALAALWPLAHRRLYSWKHLRTSLSLHRRFRLRFVRLEQLTLKLPAQQLPDCESCTNLCCTGENAVVSLRLRDIAALHDAGLERFITFERPALLPEHAKRATRARRTAEQSVFARAFPVLARDATHTCQLLREDRLCGAYPAWPLSCARYPYALDVENRVVFWAKGCEFPVTLPAKDAAPRVRNLVRAAVDAYNERVKDIVLVHLCREELTSLGLWSMVRPEHLRG